MEEERVEPPPYIHIETNDFSYRRHKRQKEEDIAVCECQYDLMDPDSACGERCWNVSTNTECTPGYCRCGVYCKNQRFQKSQYARTRLVKTEGRGWGLLADENITSGHFVIEYCGEVISSKVAKRRSQTYEDQGLTEAYIIYLNADESIDATKKGSLARFINHSCQPNCETRKWNVLGEVRVGIFAKQDIPIRTELSYDYNFEWFGGAMVRCLCGAASCSGFLGAKSRGFQEKVNKLRTCVDYDSCSCKQLFGPEKTTWSVSSKATKQLAITRCPKILCIHLLRASVSLDGGLVKRGGHISFPLVLDLFPFAGGTFSTTGHEPGPSATNMQINDLPSLHLYRQLNAQMPINMYTTAGNSPSQPRKDEVSNGGGCSLYKGNVDAAMSTSSSLSTSFSSRKELYALSAVVEHYGICGGGHYAAYRRVAPNPDANDPVQPRGKHWVYISDDHVSQVSEVDVLGAEATLLFYERL